jgi:hypothetical protein
MKSQENSLAVKQQNNGPKEPCNRPIVDKPEDQSAKYFYFLNPFLIVKNPEHNNILL